MRHGGASIGMSKTLASSLAAVFLACLPFGSAFAANASLTVVFTNNGEPLPDPAHGRVYVYEEQKRERYLAWADAARKERRTIHAVGDGTFIVDGRRIDRRAMMASKIPEGV